MKGARFVFLIPLRLCNLAGKDDSLTGILNHLYYSEKQDLLIEEMGNMEKNGGEGVCFILDGMDEYHPQYERQRIIYKLLNKVYLPQTMVIVSSRPEVNSNTLKEKANEVLELTGFSRENVLKYIDSFPFSSKVDAAKSCVQASALKDYLKSHVNIFDMCRLPMYAAMVCLLYQHKKESTFSTETKIYEELVRFMILRHYKRSDQKPPFISHSGLLEPDMYYYTLSKLAFDMTASSKYAVSVSETPDDPDNASFFGLVTVDRTAELIDFEVVHMRSFLHTTLQEFLAAYYLSRFQNKTEQLYEAKYNQYQYNLWKFFFGLGNFEHCNFLELLNCALLEINEKERVLVAIQFAYESQRADICSLLMKISGGIAFDSKLKPSDCIAINYVISNSSEPLQTLCFIQHCTDKGQARKIWENIDSSKLLSLCDLTLIYVEFDDIRAISEQFHHCKALIKLDLSQNQLTSNNVLELAKQLKECKQIKELNFSNNLICDDSVILANHLNQLDILDISDNKISSNGSICIVRSFKTLVDTLHLQGNASVAQEDIFALASTLNSSDKMKEFFITMCDNRTVQIILWHHSYICASNFHEFPSSHHFIHFVHMERNRKIRKLSDPSQIESHPTIRNFNRLFWNNLEIPKTKGSSTC